MHWPVDKNVDLQKLNTVFPLGQGFPASRIWCLMVSEVELIIEIKGAINVTCLNHPETIPASLSPPSPQKNHLPWNCSFPFSSGIYNLVSHHPLKARGIPGLKARALSQEGLTWALHLNSCATLSLNFPEPDSLSVKYEGNNIYQNSPIRAQERQTW